MHHAYVVAAAQEKGLAAVLLWIEREMGLATRGNPDVMVLTHGFFSVEDARRVQELAMQAPVHGDTKAIVIAAEQAYHESQNALLKLFEEPPRGTHLFLIVPTIATLLPTLRSRVQVLSVGVQDRVESPLVAEFLSATPEKRSALIKRLTTGRDDEERRARRIETLELVNGIEHVAAENPRKHLALLEELQTLRGFLHDRSAPVKLVLEHLALVTPRRSSR
jgi:DNA polymerase III delta prime subunit